MLTVRPETAADFENIRQINIKAFDRPVEAHLVDNLRKHSALPISLVAFLNNIPVGHIAFSPAWIDNEGTGTRIITLAPLAVLPAFQKKGIGSRLVKKGLDYCRNQEYQLVVLVGHPDYYPRFGFKPAKPCGLDCEFVVPDEAWMVCELMEGALHDTRGTVCFRPEFRDCV